MEQAGPAALLLTQLKALSAGCSSTGLRHRVLLAQHLHQLPVPTPEDRPQLRRPAGAGRQEAKIVRTIVSLAARCRWRGGGRLENAAQARQLQLLQVDSAQGLLVLAKRWTRRGFSSWRRRAKSFARRGRSMRRSAHH